MARHRLGRLQTGKGREAGLRVVERARFDLGHLAGHAVGDLAAVGGGPHPRGVDAGAPAVGGHRLDGEIEARLPVAGAVGAEDHLRPAGAVDLDAGVGAPGVDRRLVAKEQRAPAPEQQLVGTRVRGRVEGESLGRSAGGEQRLADAVRGPGLFAAGLERQRGLEHQRRNPQRVDARRVGGQDGGQHVGLRPVGDHPASLLAPAAVQDLVIQPAGETAENGLDLGHHIGRFRHVGADQGLGQPGGGRELAHVVVGGLLVVTQRQGLVGEKARRLLRDLDELGGRPRGQGLAPKVSLRQVLGDQAGVGHRHLAQRLAVADVGQALGRQAAVGPAGAEKRDVDHGFRHLSLDFGRVSLPSRSS